MKKQILPVVLIEWEDSCSTRGWQAPEKDETTIIRSVGILVAKTPRTLTISTSHSQHGNFMDQLNIPRSCVRKMKRIKV